MPSGCRLQQTRVCDHVLIGRRQPLGRDTKGSTIRDQRHRPAVLAFDAAFRSGRYRRTCPTSVEDAPWKDKCRRYRVLPRLPIQTIETSAPSCVRRSDAFASRERFRCRRRPNQVATRLPVDGYPRGRKRFAALRAPLLASIHSILPTTCRARGNVSVVCRCWSR